MSVLSRYLNALFLRTVIATTIVILAFALLFDLLDVSDDLLSGEGSVLGAFGRYVVLRLPSLISEILPISALLAGLFTAANLLRSSEMVVIWTSGVSIFSVMLRLLPVGLLLLIVKFANDDLLVPRSIEGLRQWGVGNFAQERLGVGGEFVWFSHDNRIYRLPLGETGGMVVFELDDEGNIEARLDAAQVEYTNDAWLLKNITRQTGGRKVLVESITIDAPIDPKTLDLLYRPPQELRLLQLADVIFNDGYGAVTTERHRTWLYQRLVGAFVPLLMGLLAFALAKRFDRRQGVGGLFFKGIGIGFSFIILNGIAVAFGESGFLTPALASFGPIALLACIVFLGPWRLHRQGCSIGHKQIKKLEYLEGQGAS